MPRLLVIVFIWTQKYKEIFKSALVHLWQLYHLETSICHKTDLKLRARSGEEINCTVWWYKRKTNHKQNWKTIALDHQGKRSRQNGLDTYDWKNNLPGRSLSPSVLLATMSGKTKLKLNWLITFSSRSANWGTLFTRKEKKRKYVLTWHPLSTYYVT